MCRHPITPLERPHLALALVLAAGLASLWSPPASLSAPPARDTTPEGIAGDTRAHLARAQAILDEIAGLRGPRTVDNTLRRRNDLNVEIDAAANWAQLMESVHPDAAVRDSAEKAAQAVESFRTALSLDRRVYDALAAVDASRADAGTRRELALALRDYRRAGVNRDQPTRARIQALRDSLVRLGQAFGRNLREGRRSIYLADAGELAGLAPDYVAAHGPDSTGRIRITTASPDYIPFMNYARSDDARHRLYVEFQNRAYPQNRDVLEQLVARRAELAKLLGCRTWAEYLLADRMARTPRAVKRFLAEVDRATRRRGAEDYRLFLEQKRRDDPQAVAVHDWERRYYQEKVRSERFQFDAQELRAYFNYPQVKQGVLDLTSRLFTVAFRRVDDARAWAPDVECYEVLDRDRLLGRFYLDMHPRAGKFGSAAHVPLVNGVAGRQIPEGVLICNFPRPDSSGVALMEHEDFTTFLHEFGHLLHQIFGGHQPWIDRSGVATEQDFVEAPSSLLEEWATDPGTLRSFARHYRTGEPIPAERIGKLRAALDFGNGLYQRQQAYYSALSLECYDQEAGQVDLDRLNEDLQARYTPWPFTAGTHMYASFAHLESYSAAYYTYLWSLVIAKDLFSRFDSHDLLDPRMGAVYRRQVLDPGGSRDAADLVRDFLGRPYRFEAFAAWLNGGAGR